jgi:hypothetical protein
MYVQVDSNWRLSSLWWHADICFLRQKCGYWLLQCNAETQTTVEDSSWCLLHRHHTVKYIHNYFRFNTHRNYCLICIHWFAHTLGSTNLNTNLSRPTVTHCHHPKIKMHLNKPLTVSWMGKMPKIIISGHNTEILNSAAWINMQHYILILCGAITQKQSDHQHQTAMKTVAVHIRFYIRKNNYVIMKPIL